MPDLDPAREEIERIAVRLAQLELTLLEVVTALGMLVGELALRDDLALTKAGAVEEALEHGWQALLGVAREAPAPASPPQLRAVEPEWADPVALARLAPAALGQAMADTGAAVGAIYAIDADGTAHLVTSAGYPEDVMEQFRTLAPDADLPVAAVARSRQPLWFGERREIVERYPHLRRAHEQTEEAIGDAGVQGAVVPLLANRRVAAVVLVGFATDAASPDETRLQAVRARIVEALTQHSG